jgi:hypothetical protein
LITFFLIFFLPAFAITQTFPLVGYSRIRQRHKRR